MSALTSSSSIVMPNRASRARELLDRRRHRLRDEARLRVPDGPVRAARRRGARRVAGHPAPALPRAARAGVRPGTLVGAPGHGRLSWPEGRPGLPRLPALSGPPTLETMSPRRHRRRLDAVSMDELQARRGVEAVDSWRDGVGDHQAVPLSRL